MWSSTEMSQSRLRSPVIVSSVEFGRRSSRELADGDVLDLLEGTDAFDTALPAEAALLVTAAGRVGTEDPGVDIDRTGAQPAGDCGRRGDVGAVDLRGQSVGAVVGDAYGVVDVVVADDGEDGPEDLLLRGRI